MTPDDIQTLFTRSDGSYLFSRWGRPIAPIVFGVTDETLSVIKGAIEAIVLHAGHKMTEHDPELGVNLMLFFVRDWSELADLPDLDRLLPELDALVPRLQAANATQYRLFRYDNGGAIKACFGFVRMDAAMQDLPAESIALEQAVRSIVLWSDRAFAHRAPLARHPDTGVAVVQPDVAAVIRAVYAANMPQVAHDASHALRIYARVSQGRE